MEPKLKVLIVDDEPLARQRLRRLLTPEGDLEIVGECSSAQEALAVLEADRPDLLLLDVQMPEQDGFALLRALPDDGRPAVIFVTAFDEHAVAAFEVNAVDYLLKPVDPERLTEAIARVRRERGAAGGAGELDLRLRSLLETLAPRGRFMDRILVRRPGRISFVNVEEIHWISAEGNYVRLHLAKERHLVRLKIGTLEERLDPSRFLRIHRSVIVNLDRVRELHRLPGGDYTVLLDGGATLTMSRSYKSRFESALEREFAEAT
ncbi:MAG: LytTR family DNA-binding domain-containing protein [Thermoanaerobaculia bacterium]|nr:LytTR family DNA-binding domain-containing protein [Thermoanaerobaculia bacterium]